MALINKEIRQQEILNKEIVNKKELQELGQRLFYSEFKIIISAIKTYFKKIILETISWINPAMEKKLQENKKKLRRLINKNSEKWENSQIIQGFLEKNSQEKLTDNQKEIILSTYKRLMTSLTLNIVNPQKTIYQPTNYE